MAKFSKEQITTALQGYFRDAARPTPPVVLAQQMRMPCETPDNAAKRLLWGLITGYGHRGHRRAAHQWGTHRAGLRWWGREDRALRSALEGEGQSRNPPVDVAYIAAILARPEEEVEARWQHLNAARGAGFGLGGK